jgi:hypothetical protein
MHGGAMGGKAGLVYSVEVAIRRLDERHRLRAVGAKRRQRRRAWKTELFSDVKCLRVGGSHDAQGQEHCEGVLHRVAPFQSRFG